MTLSGDLPRMPQHTSVNLRDIRAGIHFRKHHQRHRIIGIDIDADLSEQRGEAAANGSFRLPGKPAARDMHRKSVPGQP